MVCNMKKNDVNKIIVSIIDIVIIAYFPFYLFFAKEWVAIILAIFWLFSVHKIFLERGLFGAKRTTILNISKDHILAVACFIKEKLKEIENEKN